jgi:hypothetical protein
LIDENPPLPKAATEGVEALKKAIAASVEAESVGPAEQVERLGEFLEKAFTRRYDDAPARIDDVRHLAQVANRISRGPRRWTTTGSTSARFTRPRETSGRRFM